MAGPGIWKQLEESANGLKKKLGRETVPETLMILGSGFKGFEQSLEVLQKVAMSDIPNVPVPSVQGHGSDYVVGKIDGREVGILTGRVHMYEGVPACDVVYPVRLMAQLGAQNLVLTNAAGSVDPDIEPGTIVLLDDHINLTGQSCLSGVGDDFGSIFVDMSQVYDREFRDRLGETKLSVKTGVYAGVLGPNYETPAETRYLKHIGAHVVGMSTVQEAIAARHMGLKIIGISFVTNMAGGLGGTLSHQEVLDLSSQHRSELHGFLKNVILAIK